MNLTPYQVPVRSGDKRHSNTVGAIIESITLGSAGLHSGLRSSLPPCPISTVKLTVQDTESGWVFEPTPSSHKALVPCASLAHPLPTKVTLGTLLSRRSWVSSATPWCHAWGKKVSFGRTMWFLSRATRCLSDQNNLVCSQSPNSLDHFVGFLDASGNSS